MKKHWQIKPWVFLLILALLVGSIFYAFFGSRGISFSSYMGGNVATKTDGAMAEPMIAMEEAGMDLVFGRASGEGMMMMDDESFGDFDSNFDSRLIVKNASLSMVVDDVPASITEITDYIEARNGFLVNSSVNKYDINLRGEVTVRVPSELLSETIAYVKGLGEIEDEYIEGRDITEEYVDIEAQLDNFRATEAQLLEIMETAQDVEDVLNVQIELSNVRNNIERLEARIQYLSDSVALSRLSIYLSTDPENLPVIEDRDQWKPLAVLKNALRSLVDTGVAILNSLIWLGVYLPPILLLLGLVWFIRKRLKRKK